MGTGVGAVPPRPIFAEPFRKGLLSAHFRRDRFWTRFRGVSFVTFVLVGRDVCLKTAVPLEYRGFPNHFTLAPFRLPSRAFKSFHAGNSKAEMCR